jgi:hypothetical protein
LHGAAVRRFVRIILLAVGGSYWLSGLFDESETRKEESRVVG